MPDISVIMPVFNTPEAYLRESVASVVSQEGVDVELIVVDDGSDQATASLVDSLAGTDPRIKAVHTPNGGLSRARNVGIGRSSGRYIAFIDADDAYFPGALAYMLRVAKSTGCKVVVAGHDRKGVEQTVPCEAKTAGPAKVLENCLYQHGVVPAAWAKLYDRGIFDSLRFADGLYYEDLDLCDRIFLSCPAIAVTPSKVYYYRQHPGSFLANWDPRRLDVLDVTRRLEERMKKTGRRLARAAGDRRMSANFNIFLLASRNGQEAVAEECWETLCRYRLGSLVNPKVRLKNKAGILLSFGGREFFKRAVLWLGL